ncbi:hypothetical protein [Streptomyces sp. NPDC003688]
MPAPDPQELNRRIDHFLVQQQRRSIDYPAPSRLALTTTPSRRPPPTRSTPGAPVACRSTAHGARPVGRTTPQRRVPALLYSISSSAHA